MQELHNDLVIMKHRFILNLIKMLGIVFSLSFIGGMQAYGQKSTTWTGGGTAGDWEDTGNWTSGVPSSNDTAIFELSATITQPAMTDSFGALIVSNGATLNNQITLKILSTSICFTPKIFLQGSSTIINHDSILIAIDCSRGILISGTSSLINNGAILIDAVGSLNNSNDEHGIVIISGTLQNNTTGHVSIQSLLPLTTGIELNSSLSNLENFGRIEINQFSKGIEIFTSNLMNQANGVLSVSSSTGISSASNSTLSNSGLIDISDGIFGSSLGLSHQTGVFVNEMDGQIVIDIIGSSGLTHTQGNLDNHGEIKLKGSAEFSTQMGQYNQFPGGTISIE